MICTAHRILLLYYRCLETIVTVREIFRARCQRCFHKKLIDQFQTCAVDGTDSVTLFRHAQSMVLTL